MTELPRARLRRVISSIVDGPFGSNLASEHYVDEGARVIRLGNIGTMSFDNDDKAFINIGHFQRLRRHEVLAGDLLVAGLGDSSHAVGRTCIAPAGLGSALVKADCFRLRVREDLADPRFVAWFMNSVDAEHQVGLRSRGATRVRATPDVIIETVIPLFALDEQRRIADFLDDQVARIDNIVAAREKQAALLVEERESDIGRVFLDASSNPVVPLRRVVGKWIDYRGATPEKVESGIPLITAANVRDGRIVFDGVEEFVAENEYERWMRRGLPLVGDILLTTEAPLGQIAQIESTRVALAQRIILMRPDPETLWPRWIYWYLRSPVGRAELWSRATGSTAPGIKAERLTAVPIPVPPLLDQRRLLEPVERSESQLRDARAGLAISVRLLSELKGSLITAAVTGEFDVLTADGSRVPV